MGGRRLWQSAVDDDVLNIIDSSDSPKESESTCAAGKATMAQIFFAPEGGPDCTLLHKNLRCAAGKTLSVVRPL